MSFTEFARRVDDNFKRIESMTMVRINIDKQLLWETYLEAIPAEHNQVFRQTRAYDSAYDRQYIKRLGNVIGVDDEMNIHTLWDGEMPSYYTYPAQALRELLLAHLQEDPYCVTPYKTKQTSYGHQPSLDNHIKDLVWNHFYSTPTANLTNTVAKDVGIKVGEMQSIRRSLEWSVEHIDMVLNTNNSRINKPLLEAFKLFSLDSAALPLYKKPLHIIKNLGKGFNLHSKSLGVFLSSLHEGMPYEHAKRRYEEAVSAENYMRTQRASSLSQIERARAELVEAGLLDSLYRRLAVKADIPQDLVLFTKQYSSAAVKDPFQVLAESSKVTRSKLHGKDLSLDEFLALGAQDIKIYVEDLTRLMTLTSGTPGLFKWDHGLSWSYRGGYADSVKERVKQFGGNVDAEFRISLGWNNADDLDLHLYTPYKSHVYFRNKRDKHFHLDLDMNGLDKHDPDCPVENIVAPKLSQVAKGRYCLEVNNYLSRMSVKKGFNLEIAIKDKVHKFFSETSNNTKLYFTFDGENVVWDSLPDNLKLDDGSREAWGIKTNTYVPVSVLMRSPDSRHLFFILDGCESKEDTLPFFNENLAPELHEHRRTMEMVAKEMMIQPSPDQLSGLGYSGGVINVMTDKGVFNIHL